MTPTPSEDSIHRRNIEAEEFGQETLRNHLKDKYTEEEIRDLMRRTGIVSEEEMIFWLRTYTETFIAPLKDMPKYINKTRWMCTVARWRLSCGK